MKFFYVLSNLTEQILILRLWCVECPGGPSLTNTQTDGIDTRSDTLWSWAQHSTEEVPVPRRTSHRRPPRRLRHPESLLVPWPLSVTVRSLGASAFCIQGLPGAQVRRRGKEADG